MTRVYMSSTYEDLERHREAVFRALRRLPVDLIAMEEYVAMDKRPLKKCVSDVLNCQIYLGIFAWRYGYIPPKSNPEKRSITELEFRAAEGSERLVFLARYDHPWQPTYIDAVAGEPSSATKLKALREELEQELMCDFFGTPDNLAALATGAVSMAISSAKPATFALPTELTDVAVIKEFGSTLTPEIVAKVTEAIEDAAGARVVEIDLGTGKTWWSTRLFLLAALAEDFTDIESLMFVHGSGRLVGMASPTHVRRALELENPGLRESYRRSLPADAAASGEKIAAVVDIAQQFRQHWADTEVDVKLWMSAQRLRSLLGERLITAHVGLDQKRQANTASLVAQVIDQRPSLVPVTVKGIPRQVMDRVALATNIASSGLESVL